MVVAIVGALLVLAGCRGEAYNDVVKTPAPAVRKGYWQSKRPQRKLGEPEAIASAVSD